jgi:large subunit ribosomal protein L13
MAFTTETIDATDKTLGRIATQAAILLRGKNLPTFAHNVMPSVHVKIINASKLRFTGKKLDQKRHYHFSGYPGGLRETKLRDMFEKNPERMVKLAVLRMLPDNKLRKRFILRLQVTP